MRKAGILIMIIAVIVMLVFGIVFYHPVTDNVVDSNGFWAYMYGPMSVPWVVYAGGVVFFMGLTMFFSSLEQKSQRF
jgi:hypothetical protein